MNDLADKAGILTLQKTTVEASLTKLNQNFNVCIFSSVSGLAFQREMELIGLVSRILLE